MTITIDEAIARLTEYSIIAENHYNFALQASLQLGIEALKIEKRRREESPAHFIERLPGEITK